MRYNPCVEALRQQVNMEEDPVLKQDYHRMKGAGNGLTVTLVDGEVFDLGFD